MYSVVCFWAARPEPSRKRPAWEASRKKPPLLTLASPFPQLTLAMQPQGCSLPEAPKPAIVAPTRGQGQTPSAFSLPLPSSFLPNLVRGSWMVGNLDLSPPHPTDATNNLKD